MRQYVAILRHSKTVPILIIFTFCFQLATQEMQAWTPDPEPDYQYFIMPYVQQCNLFEYPHRGDYTPDDKGVPIYGDTKSPTRDPLKWWANCLSYKLTDSPKFIPIIFNVAIIPLTYLIAVSLTRDRLIGFIAVSALILNPIFARYVGSGTYDSVWSFFLLLSCYLLIKSRNKIDFSIPTFLLSLAAKAICILYIPAWLYTLYKSDRSRKAKIILVLCLVGIISAAGMVLGSHAFAGASIKFHPENAELAVSQNIKMLWEILPVLIVSIGVNRLLAPSKRIAGRGIVFSWLIAGFMTTPLIYLFSDQLQFVYRFTPFLVFMSIYIGIVIIESGNRILEQKLKHIKV